jgi:hypothetical protein
MALIPFHMQFKDLSKSISQSFAFFYSIYRRMLAG